MLINKDGEQVREVDCMGCNNIRFIVDDKKGICLCPQCDTKTKYLFLKNGGRRLRNEGKMRRK